VTLCLLLAEQLKEIIFLFPKDMAAQIAFRVVENATALKIGLDLMNGIQQC
jgi:hypothetical protein